MICENNCLICDYFTGNHIRIVIGCCFYWLLSLLHTILEKTKTLLSYHDINIKLKESNINNII